MKSTQLICSAAFAATMVLAVSPAIARDEVKAEVSTTTTRNSGDLTTRRTTTQKLENSNGQSVTVRETGLDRAEDRMSAQGLAHSQAMKNRQVEEEHSTTTTTIRTPR